MKTIRSFSTLITALALFVSGAVLPAIAAPVQLTTSAFNDWQPQWNAAGTKIAYAKQVSSGGSFDIGQVNADGTGEGFLATNVNIQSYGVSWLGNTGKLLVAEVNVFHELFEFNAAAYTTAAPFNRTASDGNDAAFTRKLFVPGGNNSNIFISSRNGARAVWRDSPNTGGTTTIRTALYSSLAGQNTNAVGTVLLSSSNSVYGLRGMALTPDGSKLVISLPTAGTGFDLWLYNTDGSGSPLQLTSDGVSGIFNGGPDVSPDGTKIIFVRSNVGVAGSAEIYQMNLNGTGLTNITNTPGVDESQPSWAPNGTDYAFIRLDGGGTNWNIYKDTLAGSTSTVTINFDNFPVGLLAANALASYGIPSVTFGGTGPGAGGMRIFDNTGSNHIIPSPPNLMAQDGNSNDPNQTHFLRFNFTPELTAFSLKRTGKNGGGSTDTWRAYFYNAAGTLLGDFGESTPIINAPVTLFSFTAPGGQTIARMDLVSIWTGFATNRNIPVDDFVLTSVAGTGDTTPPNTTITAAEPSLTNDPTGDFTFTSSEAGSTFEVRVDGSAYAVATSPFSTASLGDGAHTFEVRAIDAAGNVDPTPASASWTLDTAPPETTITAAEPSPTNDPTADFTFSASEPGSTFEVRVDGGAYATATSPFSTALLGDGAHTFELRAIDPAGNVDPTPASASWTLDTAPPETTITAAEPSPTNDPTGDFTFTSSEAGSTFEVRVDGGAYAIAPSPFSTAPLADGPHTFEVRAIDAAGDVDPTPASASWVVDTTPPVITFTPGLQTVHTGSSATAPLPDVATLVTATDAVGVVSQTQSPAAGTQKAPGTHDVVVTVSDAAGNSAQTTVQVLVVDNGAPVFTTCPPARSIHAASNETSIVLGDLISEAVAEDNIGVTGITQDPIAGTVLEAGDHTVRLTATDAEGNSGVCDVVVTVVPGNKIPVALPDFAFSTAGGVLIDVLENDSDGDGQPLTISEVTQSPDGGVATIQGGKIFYDPEGAVTTSRTFTYTITDGEDTATATVTIYENPALGYTYVGHLFDTDGTTHRGLMMLKLASGTGRFTGSIFIGAKKYGLKGTFSSESPTVAIAGASRLFAGIPVLVSAGPLDGAGFPQIGFSVAGTAPGTRWRGLAERSPYFRLTTGQLLSPAAGKHTVLFEQSPGSAQPVVAGGCLATVTVPGAARFSGKFGNGGALSTATYLLSGGRAIFYAPGAKSGVYQTLAGTLVFAPAADRDVSGDVLWSVPPGFDAKIPGGLVDTYPVVGSRYSSSLNKLSPANLMLDYNATGDATFSFELPSSNRTVDVLRNITTPAIVTGLPPLALVKFTQSSGYYSGTFVDKPVTPGAKFQGWVLQHPAQNRGNGYVLDTDRIGSVSLTPAP